MSRNISTNNNDLESPYFLSEDQINSFRANGFIKLKNVLSAETLEYYRKEIKHMVFKLSNETRPLEERSTYEKAFLQIENIFLHCQIVKEFVSSQRLGRIAAELLGTRGVRMYHDQALYKEAGGGHTPWHVDQVYWPFSSDKSITAWIPLVPISLEMGPLAFAAGSHKIKECRNMIISDESESKIQQMMDDIGVTYSVSAFDLGDVSFHYGWTFHRADENKVDIAREVMTMIYMDIDMKITRKDEPWCPDTKPGEIPNNHKNFVIYEK
ncbi:MAG: phytanoyl-CoA dioxygenase family protein [Ignavibacteriaceae bacterium]